MHPTRIHVTEVQRRTLRAWSQRTGRSQRDSIRVPVDRYITPAADAGRRALLAPACGKDRDLPSVAAPRGKLDRAPSHAR